MRPIKLKLFGLAAVAAVTAMAFVGASSAMAGSTLLCSLNAAKLDPSASECATPEKVHFLTVGTEGEAEAPGTLFNSVQNVSCVILLAGTRTSAALANPVVFKGEIKYSKCNCTTTVLTQGTISVLKTGVELANVTLSGFVFKVNCFGIFDCDFEFSNVIGHGLAGPGGKAHVTYAKNLVNLKEDLGSFFKFCPKTATLSALFQSLTPLYFRA